jgi:FlaA1/EpsC-like NDP-sugar epimerase
VLLGVVSAALGATSLGYNTLGDQYLTLAGVLLTFAFLLQLGSYLADVNRAPAEERAPSFLGGLVVHRRRFVEALVDFALIGGAFAAAYAIRVQGEGTPWMRHVFYVTLPAVLVARYLSFIVFGLYRGVWRYAGARDAVSIFAAVVVSEVIAFVFIWLTTPFNGFPTEIFILDALLCTAVIGAARFWERAVAHALSGLIGRSDQRRVLIVGAGRSGRSLLRELRETRGERVIAFVDDDPELLRRRIQGVAVVGGTGEIGWVIGRHNPDAVFVTIPEAPRDRLDAVAEACARAGITCGFVRRQIDTGPGIPLGAAAE